MATKSTAGRKSTAARKPTGGAGTTSDSRQAALEASTAEAAERAANATPLEERQAEANERGYHGRDAADLEDEGLDTTRPPIKSGVHDAPGGHPADPTTNDTSGAAG